MKRWKLLTAFFLLLAVCALALGIAAIRHARLLPSETGISVPIFMYHAVGNDCWGEESLFVKPEELEKQLQYLSENGYETIFFEDLAHIEQYEKPVMLTFDDGYDDNSTNLLPLLQKYGMKATIFLIAGDVGKRHKLTREQISELVQSGLVSIQSHGWSHRNMANLPPLELLLEMARSQSAIAALTGRPPTALSYPNGSSNERVRKIAVLYLRRPYLCRRLCNRPRPTADRAHHRQPRYAAGSVQSRLSDGRCIRISSTISNFAYSQKGAAAFAAAPRLHLRLPEKKTYFMLRS